ncbi:type IV pilus biogenesis/stability protein PilW [Litoribrevibacter euphylliae]|uniref:Type IV pilus biogenesis/stability protein PilW n=1 Tax=Litoribrevibacter euphylliae TaxID=1834034 RepID=A0ABV7H8I6_9GAMM
MNFNINSRTLVFGVLLGLIALVSGCTVVETHSRFTEKKDIEKNIDFRVKAAFLHLQRGHTEPAKLKATEVLQIQPNHAPAMSALALALDKEGEPVEAEKYYKNAIKTDPKYTRGKELYGVFLYSKGRYDEALSQFEKVVDDKLYENLAAANLNLGLCALKLKKTDRARSAFEKSSVINPKQTKPYIHLARISYAEQDYRFAARYFRNYERNLGSVNNYTPRTLLLGYQIQKGAKRNELAARYVQLLAKLYPNSPEYSEVLKQNAFQNSGSL